MFCFLVEEVSWASVLVTRQEKQGFSISATLSIPFHCEDGAPFQEIWEVFQVCPQVLCVCVWSCFSHVQLFVTLCTEAYQAPLSMGFSRQSYWSGLPCPPPGNLPNPGIKLRSFALQVDSLPSEPPGKLSHAYAVAVNDLMKGLLVCTTYG